MLQQLDSDSLHMIITTLCYTDASTLSTTCVRLRISCLCALNAVGTLGAVRAFTVNLSLFNSAMRSLTAVPVATLHHAAYHGDIDVVQQLKNAHSPNWSTMVSSRTVFHARDLYSLTAVRLTDLTVQDASPLFGAIDDTECTALHIALIMGWTAVCEVLLQAAPRLVDLAVMDFKSYGPFHGATPLHLAVINDSVEVARMLLANGAEPAVRDAKGVAPIHCARSSEMIEALIGWGARIDVRTVSVDMYDDDGYQLLHFAAHNGFVDVMRHICENYQIDVTVMAENTYQPVHCAAISGRVDALKFLVTRGVSLDSVAGENWTPVHCACQNGHLDTVAYLDTMGCNMLALDSVGWSPLHVAIASGCSTIVSYYLDRGCDIGSVAGCTEVFDFVGMTAIHLACLSNSVNIVALLLSRDICLLDQSDDRGLSPLHYASAAGAIEVVSYLLEAGADMYAVESSGFGCAHYAQTALLADSDDRDGIFTLTERNNYRNIIELLLGAGDVLL